MERKRKRSTDVTMEIIEEKKQRKVSMGTMDTDRSLKQAFQDKTNNMDHILEKTQEEPLKNKDQIDEKLSTDQQIEILDTINEL